MKEVWLQELRIKNFRSCLATTVEFSEDLTLLIGENDGGKSNIINAMRLAIPPASGRPTAWFDEDKDPTYGIPAGGEIEISRTYGDLTTREDAFFMPALVDADRRLVHTTTFSTDPDVARRHRVAHSVGTAKIADPEPENRGRIAHVYLPPLRDAARALDSAEGSKLVDVFRVLNSTAEIREFEAIANASLGELAKQDAATRVKDTVQTHLSSVTRPVRHRVVDLQHQPQPLTRLVRALRLHMAAAGLTPTDLIGSGLGYANLLYVAAVVLELEKARDFDLLLMLVEEPEAHLHPQLQSVLLGYLQEQAALSSKSSGTADRLGRIQVVATSHSPHLASTISTRNLVAVRAKPREASGAVVAGLGKESVPASGKTESTDGGTTGATGQLPDGPGGTQGAPTDPSPVYTETVCIHLASLPLTDTERRKIDRYLNATRAALLFSRQVVLLEGIAEAVLLRSFAECLLFPTSADAEEGEGLLNRRRREQFRAVSTVAIDGVDFEPYLRLLLGNDKDTLVDRVVVVTDGDNGAGTAREKQFHAAFPNATKSGCLVVSVGGTTLEAELYASPANEEILRQAFAAQHPRSLDKWDALGPRGPEAGDLNARAIAFSAALKEKTLDLGKGDFAHVIADLLAQDESESFKVPAYLEKAIKAVLIGDESWT